MGDKQSIPKDELTEWFFTPISQYPNWVLNDMITLFTRWESQRPLDDGMKHHLGDLLFEITERNKPFYNQLEEGLVEATNS